MKKLVCAILTLSMFTSLCACSSEPSPSTTPDTTKANEEMTTISIDYEPDELPDLDFGNETITILSLEKTEGTERSDYESEFTVEELSNNIVSDSIYNREIFVEDRLNVDIQSIKSGNVTNEIDKALTSGDDNYDIIVHANHILSKYTFEDYLVDLYSVEHLDLDKPWWSGKFNSEVEFFDNLYLTTGSACLSLIRNTYAMYFNKALVDDYLEQLPELGDLYSLVNDGKWTWDKFVELGGGIYQDLNGNSKRDYEDLYGIAYNAHCAIDAMWSGFNIDVFSKDSDGWFELNVNEDKLYNSLEKMHTMLYETNGSICNNVADDKGISYYSSAMDTYFASGTNLFWIGNIGYAETQSLRNMQDDYGMLPYPKYDESQKEYYSYSHDTYGAVAIPVTSTKQDMAGAVLEAMASYSYRHTMPLFLDTVLKGQYMSDIESRHAVDLIVEGIMIDASWVYLHTLAASYPETFRYMFNEGDESYASTHVSLSKKVETVLKINKRELQQ